MFLSSVCVRRWSRAVVLAVAVVCLAASMLAVPVAGAQAGAPQVEEVEARDRLIADQENLLNAYRCMFNTDTEVVPGGCPDPDAVSPGAAPPNPTPDDVSVRDGLIQSQEALLNVYRCQYSIDTHVVPGGCADNTPPAEPTPSPSTPIDNTIRYRTALRFMGSDFREYFCAPNPDKTIACSIDGIQVDAPDVPLTDIDAHFHFAIPDDPANPPEDPLSPDYETSLCGLTAEQAPVCWTWGEQRDDDGNWHWFYTELDAPPGPFTKIEGDRFTVREFGLGAGRKVYYRRCGWRANQIIACWSYDRDWSYDREFTRLGPSILVEWDAPAGQFTETAAIGYEAPDEGRFAGTQCGLRADQTVACWHWVRSWVLVELDAPAGEFTSISDGDSSICGLRADQTVACWYWEQGDWDEQRHAYLRSLVELDAPAGQFT